MAGKQLKDLMISEAFGGKKKKKANLTSVASRK